LTFQQIQAEWPEVIRKLANISRSTWALAQSINVTSFAENILTLEFASQADSDTFKKTQGAPGHLREAIQEILGLAPQFRATIAPGAAPAPVVTTKLPSMPAPAPSMPAPAPVATAPVAAAPVEPQAPVEPDPEVAAAPEVSAPAQPPKEEPQQETKQEPQQETKSKVGKMHTGATYGEPLLREILGAKPVDDPKSGR
jgi:outer membrane biosynthesis protein TonB